MSLLLPVWRGFKKSIISLVILLLLVWMVWRFVKADSIFSATILTTLMGTAIGWGVAAFPAEFVAFFRNRRAKEFFGQDFLTGRAVVVVPEFRQSGNVMLVKPGKPAPDLADKDPLTYVSGIADLTDLAAAGHAAQLLARLSQEPVQLLADCAENFRVYRDEAVSVISIGAWTNWFTDRFGREVGNKLPSLLATNQVVSLGRPYLPHQPDAKDTFGLIAKLNPRSHPGTAWFICAGADLFGTEGAAWFLANRWEKLYGSRVAGGTLLRGQPFAAVIQTAKGSPQSAQVLDNEIKLLN